MSWDSGSHEETLEFDSGFLLRYNVKLDGGGNSARHDFVEIINGLGKRYQHAMEWCAGHGAIGYELLTKNLCANIHFVDIFEPAIESCLRNAQDNNVQDRVFGYISSAVKNLPTMPLIDLVVSNPPHNPDINGWDKSMYSGRTDFKDDRDNYNNGIRLGVDDQFKIHEEFFANIIPRLAPDADILLSEAAPVTILIDMAAKYGLVCVKRYDNAHAAYGGQTIHLKVKK